MKNMIDYINSATKHYNYDTHTDMFAIDVKIYSFTIPEDITGETFNEVFEDEQSMSHIWHSAKSIFEDMNPDFELRWFGRSGGWIGFDGSMPEKEDFEDEDQPEGGYYTAVSKLFAAISMLCTIRTMMFESLWNMCRNI